MNIISKFVIYLRSSRHELTKVTWPSKQLTTRYSILVITISLAVAAFFGFLDMGLTKVVNITLVENAVQRAPAGSTAAPIVPTTEPLNDGSQPVQPDFNFGDIEFETEGPDGSVEVNVVPIEESTTDNQ
jgi:preprotein translocase subunit SecE